MAYKFQAGDAILSGNLLQEGDVEIETGFSLKVHEQTILDTNRNLGNVGTISGSGQISGPSLAVDLDATVGADIIMSQGGNVYLAGDGGAAKILSSGGNAVSIFGAKVVTNGSSIEPDSDNGTDLGSSSKEFKDLYLDGVAYIDDLRADQLGAALDANDQAITNINVDSGAIDGTVIGANSAAAGTFTTLVAGGDVDLGDATSDTITATGRFDSDLVPSSDSARALGTSALQWSAVHVDVGHIDQLGAALDANSQAITNINVDSGAMDGVVIGANSAAAATLSTLKVSDLTAERVPFIGTAGEIEDSADFGYNDDGLGGGKFLQVRSRGPVGNNFTGIMAKTASISVLNAAEDGLLAYVGYDGALSASNKLEIGGTVRFDGVADTALDVAADSFYYLDAGDSLVKKDSMADYATAIAGTGIKAASGVLALDVNELSQAAVADGDFIIIEDATDNSTKKEAVADLASLFAGTGLKAASSVMALDVQELSQAAVASGDFFVIEDATDNSTKKESVDDLASLFAGTGLKAASAVLSLDVQELSEAAVASGDFFVIQDATDDSTKKESVDDLATLFAGNGLAAASAVLSLDLNELTAADVAVGDDSIAIIDATDNSTKKESITDLVAAMAGSGLSATNGVLSTQGSSVAVAVDGGTLSEGYNFATGSLSLSVTLPSGSAGDVIHVKAAALGDDQTLTINRQGSQTIDGQTSVVLESQYAAVSLVYVTDNDWRII